MSLLMLGISHRTATLPMLERVALGPQESAALAAKMLLGPEVSEALVLATCNRIEMYAEVDAFHPGILHLGECFAQATGVPLTELAEHLVVKYADRVVSHLFSVACGLESMAIGEGQVLGQLRHSLRRAQEQQQAGPHLEQVVQRALRVGKRAHAETDLDRFGGSLIDAGLARAESSLGPLAETRVLILGAGSISALAATTIGRLGVAQLLIVNRTHARAEHLAGAVAGRALPWSELPTALRHADLVIACTGATEHIVDRAMAQAAQLDRAGRPQHYL
ncbi:MAG: glutamyl-tRNA reductase, partial [Angustibacter sp.]